MFTPATSPTFGHVTAAAEWAERELLGVIEEFSRAKAIVARIRSRGIRDTAEATRFLRLSAFVAANQTRFDDMNRNLDRFLVLAATVAPETANAWNAEIGRAMTRATKGLSAAWVLPALGVAIIASAAAAPLILAASAGKGLQNALESVGDAIRFYGNTTTTTVAPDGSKTTTSSPTVLGQLTSPATLLIGAGVLFLLLSSRRRQTR